MTQNSQMKSATGVVTLQSRFSRLLTILVITICVVTEIGLVLRGDVNALVRGTAPLAFAALGSYALFWMPLIRITPATVEIVNPTRSYAVTWPAIDDIETRWALTLVTSRGKITAWAAPAQSRYGSLSRLRRDSYGRADYAAEHNRLRHEDLPSSVAGLAPMLVIRQWEEYRDAGLLGEIEGEGVTVRWHTALLLALGALAALSLIAAVA